jgi:endonuclease/exonuclease/phosphatase family metal-dependent hydrolase
MPNAARRAACSLAPLTPLPLAPRAWPRPRPARGFLELDSPESPVRILGVHLTAGMTARGERVRLREADRLVALVGSAPKASVVVGDFNSIAPGDRVVVGGWPLWLRILLRVDGGIRRDVIAFLERNGLPDTFRRLHPAEPGYTLPPRDPSVRLDYLLSTVDALPLVRACAPVLPAAVPLVVRASDHLPLLSVIEAAPA